VIDFRKSLSTTLCIAAVGAGCATDPTTDETDVDSDARSGLPAEGELGTANVVMGDKVQEVTYRMINGVPVADGDIELRPDQVDNPLFAAPAQDEFTHSVDHWTGGVVPYVIQANHPSAAAINAAIANLQRRTAVRFVPKTSTSPNWIEFVNDTSILGCGQSGIGRAPYGAGRQTIKINGACAGTGLVIHEIQHALGYWHEQSRADRRFFVEILWDNIIDDADHNFEVRNVDEGLAPGVYDFGSIMHYSAFAFGKVDPVTGQTLPTIRRLDGQPLVTQRVQHSDTDLRSLNAIYPPAAGESPHVCRTAPPRTARGRRRVDVGEIWQDVNVQNQAVAATSFGLHRSNATSYAPPVDTRTTGGWSPKIRWSVGDYDGDGDQDFMAVWNDGGSNTLTLWRSNGLTFSSTHWGVRMGGWADSTQWVPGDYNNDGFTDLAAVWKNGTGSTPTTMSVYLSNGSSFIGWQNYAVQAGGWNDNTKWNVGDFNNDGRDDLFAAWQSGTNAVLTVWLATADSRFVAQHWFPAHGGWANNMQWITGNFDGQPGTDVISVWKDGTAPTFTLYRASPANAQFLSPIQWATRDGGWDDRHRYMGGDVDADGLDDVIATWNDAGMSTLTVRRSGGTSSVGHVHFSRRTNGWQNSGGWCAGSFNGI
jgi:hypothetical protein